MKTIKEELMDLLSSALELEYESRIFYKQIYKKVSDNRDGLGNEFQALEHGLRQIIVNEQEHVVQISSLITK